MDPMAQSKWRWLIAAYLFLAGLGGGAYATGVVADFLGAEWAGISKIGVSLGLPCVLAGCLFLLVDLGSPAKFWRAGMRPNTSWIARGTIIIMIFMTLGALHIAFWVWPLKGLADAEGARRVLGVIGGIFAFGTMIYTGILLGAARPIAFWSTAMLPLLFLVSALSTGVMAVVFIATLMSMDAGLIHALARADILLIILEMFVLLFFFQATHRVPESRLSARIVLAGEAAPLFWLGVAVLGLVAPLLLELFDQALVAAICGIIGGLFLRQVVLRGGIHAPLKVGRFEVGVPNV